MMTPNSPTRSSDELDVPESLASLWEAIPVDVAANAPPARSIFIPPASARVADGQVLLSVEESDVGLG